MEQRNRRLCTNSGKKKVLKKSLDQGGERDEGKEIKKHYKRKICAAQ